jgi:hypothetical protein
MNLDNTTAYTAFNPLSNILPVNRVQQTTDSVELLKPNPQKRDETLTPTDTFEKVTPPSLNQAVPRSGVTFKIAIDKILENPAEGAQHALDAIRQDADDLFQGIHWVVARALIPNNGYVEVSILKEKLAKLGWEIKRKDGFILVKPNYTEEREDSQIETVRKALFDTYSIFLSEQE